MELTTTQRTSDWYLARMGKFTASKIECLMKPTDVKKGTFDTDTCKSYIYLTAGERQVAEKLKDADEETITNYMRVQHPSSKAMDWGTEHEPQARRFFEFAMGVDVEECGSMAKDERPWLSASPDGIIDKDTLIEIKCPNVETYMRYVAEISNADTLRASKPEYYWQIQCQMYVTDAKKCWFVVYHPLIGEHHVLIERVQTDIDTMLERADRAWEIVNSLNII